MGQKDEYKEEGKCCGNCYFSVKSELRPGVLECTRMPKIRDLRIGRTYWPASNTEHWMCSWHPLEQGEEVWETEQHVT